MSDTEERPEVNSQSRVKASDDKKWSEHCRTFIVKDAHGSVKELVFPKALDLDRPKRERTTFSSQQLTRLEDEFRRNHYLIGKDRTAVAKRLGLTETQVKVWFQNRRTKHKKDNERQGEDKDSRAESQAAQNVLKLLEYKTVFDYTNILSQKPSDVSLPQTKSYIPKSCLECNDKTNNSLSSIESGNDALSGRSLTSNFRSFSTKLSDDCNSDSVPRVKNAPSGGFHDVTSCATWFPAHFESRPYPGLSLPLVQKSESPIHSPRYNKPIWKLADPSDKYGTFPSDSFDPLKDFRRNPNKTVEEYDITDDHHQIPDRTFSLDCAFARTDSTPERVNSALCFENHCPAGFESRQSVVDQSIFSSEHPLYDKHPGQTSNHGMHALSTHTDPVLKLTRPMITHKDKYCDTGRTALTDTICPTAASAKTVQVPTPPNMFSQGNSRVDQQCRLHHRQQLHKTSESSYIISTDSVSPSLHTIHQSNRSSFSDYSSSIHSKTYAYKVSSSKWLSPHSPVDKLSSERHFQDNQTYCSRSRPTPYNLSASHLGFVDPSCAVSSASNMMPKFFCHPHTDNP